MYLNKAIIIGNLTRDPELKALPSGIQVANMGVATNRVWKDKEGNKQESVEFHNIVVYGKQAEASAQYLKKGQSVLVEGRIQTRSWEADGIKKYMTEIIADRVQFGPRRDGGSGTATPVAQPVDGGMNQDAEAPKSEGIDYPEEEINPDDIPF